MPASGAVQGDREPNHASPDVQSPDDPAGDRLDGRLDPRLEPAEDKSGGERLGGDTEARLDCAASHRVGGPEGFRDVQVALGEAARDRGTLAGNLQRSQEAEPGSVVVVEAELAAGPAETVGGSLAGDLDRHFGYGSAGGHGRRVLTG